jgi:Polyketide cyclase / dehydrase and lipid transport
MRDSDSSDRDSRACDTECMISVSGSVCIDAPAERVWAALARLEDIRLWSDAVRDAHCDGAISRGVGAERTCDLLGGVTLRERWLEWDEGRSFTYEGVGIPMVAQARNEWTVHPAGDQALLTSRAQVLLKGGMLGKLFEPLVRFQINRVGPRTLAAFKHLVEHGQPPPGKHANLPRIPTAC